MGDPSTPSITVPAIVEFGTGLPTAETEKESNLTGVAVPAYAYSPIWPAPVIPLLVPDQFQADGSEAPLAQAFRFTLVPWTWKRSQ